MTLDYVLDYWKDAAACALDEVEVTLSDEQLTAVAKSLICSRECEGMAFGPPPENPLRSEMRQLEREMAAEKECRERRENLYRGALAQAMGVSARTLVIYNGQVEYDPRLA